MSFCILVQLPTAGINTGPFDIFALPSNTQVANNVPRSSLLAPALYLVCGIPDGTTEISVKSDNLICNNSVNTVLDLPCYCNEISAMFGTATIEYIQCGAQDNFISTFDVANEKQYVCAKLGTTTKKNVTGTVEIIPTAKTCSIDDDCAVEPPLCHEIEIIGTSTISWLNAGGTTSTYTYSNVTINVCASRGSITHVGGTVNITPGTTYCEQESDCWPALNLNAVAINKFMIRQVQIWGAPYTPNQAIIPWMVDYGDGFTLSYTGSQTFTSPVPSEHTYAGLFTGTIQIKAPSLQLIKSLISNIAGQSFTTGNVTLIGSEVAKLENLSYLQNYIWNLNANTIDFSRSLTFLYSEKGIVSGNVSNLPTTLTHISLFNGEANTLSGNLIDLPIGLTILRIDGSNNISGNVSTLPVTYDTQLVRLLLGGNNTISGNLSEFATYTDLIEFDVKGKNLLIGSICNFSTLTLMQRLVITGYGEPDGNLSCLAPLVNLITLQFENDETDPYVITNTVGNTITGDINNISDTVRTCIIRGNNTVSGNISNMPAGTGSLATNFNISGDNLLSGNIANIKTNCQLFLVQGYNTLSGTLSTIPTGTIIRFIVGTSGISGITGNIATIPPTITQFGLAGNITVNTYLPSPGPGRTWAPNMNYFVVEPNNKPGYFMPTAQIDRLLQDLAATSWATTGAFPTNQLTLVGTRSIPATNPYVTTLTSPPRNVVVNIIAP